MGCGNLSVEPKDLRPTTFDFDTFIEQNLQPAAGASTTPAFEPTLEVAAIFLHC